MKKKISKRTVDLAKPQERDYFLWDTDLRGFGLKVTPKGNKVYIIQYRPLNADTTKAPKRYTIGNHGPLTPDQARRTAQSLLADVRKGRDPMADKIAAKKELTVAQLCDLYLEEGCSTKKASTLSTDKGRIERHIKPLLGAKKISQVTRGDITRFLKDVVEGKTALDQRTGRFGRAVVTGGRGTATRTVGLLGGIFTFAVNKDLVALNPVHGVKRFSDRKHERFLSEDELKKLGAALKKAENEDENSAAISAIRLLVFTGCRKTEILSLKWDFIDWETGYLKLPESKTGAKLIPLNPPAQEILSNIPRVEDSPFVFPAHRGEGHYVGLPKAWRRIREKAGLSDVRLHDLRHTFASQGVGTGESLYVIGKVLGHKDSATTSRYAHLAKDPVKKASEKIANNIASIMESQGKESRVLKIRNKK